MPTGLSSTDAGAGSAGTTSATRRRTNRVAAARRAVVDVGHLVRFRAGTVRRRRALPLTAGILAAITLAACTLPMLLPGARDLDGKARDVVLLLPTIFAGFLLLTVVSSVASGGGRELLNRDQGVAFPVSPTTDHLGALLMAPLNIAWLLQTWAMLGSAAYALPVADVAPAQIVILLWVAAATSAAQIVAWTMEAIRRRRHGRWVVRAIVLAFVRRGRRDAGARHPHRLPRPPAHRRGRRPRDAGLRGRLGHRRRAAGRVDRRRGRGRRRARSPGSAPAAARRGSRRERPVRRPPYGGHA